MNKVWLIIDGDNVTYSLRTSRLDIDGLEEVVGRAFIPVEKHYFLAIRAVMEEEAFDKQLSLIGQPHANARQRPTHRPSDPLTEVIARHYRSTLGCSVSFHDFHAQTFPALGHLRWKLSAAAYKKIEAAAETPVHIGE